MRIMGIAATLAVAALAAGALMTTTHTQKANGRAPNDPSPNDRAQVVTLSVPQMDCAGCEAGVKIAANKLDGVEDVRTSSETRTADVTFDPAKTSPEAIANAIAKATGFTVEVPNAG